MKLGFLGQTLSVALIGFGLGKYLEIDKLQILASIYVVFSIEFILHVLDNYLLALAVIVSDPKRDSSLPIPPVIKGMFIIDFIISLVFLSLVLMGLFMTFGV